MSPPSLYYGCIKVLEEGSDVGANRGSHTSKSTLKMISVDPGNTVDHGEVLNENLRHLYRLKMPH